MIKRELLCKIFDDNTGIWLAIASRHVNKSYTACKNRQEQFSLLLSMYSGVAVVTLIFFSLQFFQKKLGRKYPYKKPLQ
ncbi:MAG: hypothetical protein LBR26_13990 [Prevotella sp.]|jgi:hypothetical protein|nr:hypothetical protein [Prevotella sp.]